MHYQVGIALRTPPYSNRNIDRDVNVFVQLYRKVDNCYSLPMPFTYTPVERETTTYTIDVMDDPFVADMGILMVEPLPNEQLTHPDQYHADILEGFSYDDRDLACNGPNGKHKHGERLTGNLPTSVVRIPQANTK